MTAAAESLMPAVRRVLASSESLDQSIAQVNGLHKGVLRVGVFNSACVVWLPRLVPEFEKDYPGIEVEVYQGSYADIEAWLKNGTAELAFLSDSCSQDLDFEPLYTDPLVCIAPPDFVPKRAGRVSADELRGLPFVSQRADTDADIQNYLKRNDLHVHTSCYVIDDESMVGMVACGQGVAIMPQLLLTRPSSETGVQVLALEPAAGRRIGLACLDQNGLSPAAREFARRVRNFAKTL